MRDGNIEIYASTTHSLVHTLLGEGTGIHLEVIPALFMIAFEIILWSIYIVGVKNGPVYPSFLVTFSLWIAGIMSL